MPSLNESLISRIVTNQRPASGSKFVSDEHRDAPRGFRLRVLPSGTASFVLQYRDAAGSKHRRVIGQWPTWSVTEARAEAGRLKREIDRGNDPFAKPEPEPERYTIADLARDYLSHTANRQADRYVNALAMAHGDKLPSELTRGDVIKLVEAKAKTAPVGARQLLSYIKALLTYAVDREHIAYNVAAALKPTRVSRKMVATRRERILTDDEIVALMTAPPSNHVRVLRAILITGQRPGEVRAIAASELNDAVWLMPAEKRKNRQEHRLPLTPLADEALRAVLGNNRGVSSQTLGEAARALQPGVVDYWRPHDLRRTARTTLARLGINDDVGERVIGHAQGGLIKTYNRHSYEAQMLDALQRYHAWLGELLAPHGQAADS